MSYRLFWDVSDYLFEHGYPALDRLWRCQTAEERDKFYLDFQMEMTTQPYIPEHELIAKHFMARFPGLKGM